MYAFAASAAGVGILALAQSAGAKIVYTKTNVHILNNIPLDLNNDGTADFNFGTFWASDDCIFGSGSDNIAPAATGNRIWRNGSGYATALHPGVSVGRKSPLVARKLVMGRAWWQCSCGGTCKSGYDGPWENGGKGVTNRYLGLEFKIKGKTHYGWARLNFHELSAAYLTGYAYETIPNKPIVTGKTRGPDEVSQDANTAANPAKPATLGALARGAPGLSIWRRKESVLSAPAGN
jgi:hypothetical protein